MLCPRMKNKTFRWRKKIYVVLLVHDVTQTQRKAIYSPVELCSSISSHLFRWKKSARAPFGRLTSPYIYRKLLLNAVYSHTDCTPHHTPPSVHHRVCVVQRPATKERQVEKRKKKSRTTLPSEIQVTFVSRRTRPSMRKKFFFYRSAATEVTFSRT